MNRRQWLAGCALIAFGPTVAVSRNSIAPPCVPRRPFVIDQVGRRRVDDYAWLKPANWKDVWRDASVLDPAIRVQLEAERGYADAVLDDNRVFEDALYAEMVRRTAPDRPVPPLVDGDWEYLTRFDAGAEQPRLFRRSRRGEQLLVDGPARAAGKGFFHLGNSRHSPDHRYFAWAEDNSGTEKYRIHVRDLETGAVIADGPVDAFGSFTFSPDSRWLYWTWRDASSRPARIYRRPAGGGADTLVYEEHDPAFLMDVRLTASKAWIVIRCWNDVTSEVRLIADGAPILVEPRTPGMLYSVDHWGKYFIILTNADGAVDFKLMRAEITRLSRMDWQPLVAHRPGRFITEVRAFARHLVRVERVEGNPLLIVRDMESGVDRNITFDEAAYALMLANDDYAGDKLDIGMSSPRTPLRWERFNLASGRREHLSGSRAAQGRYELLRLHASAQDGALVPITLLRRKGTSHATPLLLTGYGSYGYSYETGFDPTVLAWVDRGWSWAVAHVRGGSEKGRDWFEQARTLHKKRSFTDFIACAEHLVAAGHAARGRIAIHGYSAGGLLVAAALNMRPDLWLCAIGQAPFVDMLNTMSDAAHPLVPLTRPVWGDPLVDPVAYDYIASYSPYENVDARHYPPVLATTAIGDDRVGFWEPAKWIAKLREKSSSGNPMLLHVEALGGHGGAAGRFENLRLMARIYAFAINADRYGSDTGLAGCRRTDGTSR